MNMALKREASNETGGKLPPLELVIMLTRLIAYGQRWSTAANKNVTITTPAPVIVPKNSVAWAV